MVRKKLAVAVLALSALQANFADAMGLGNLSVKSALNQPLDAEIKLLDTGDLDPSQIKIRLAAPEDFQRAGVDRDYFLTNLHFDVDMDGHGAGVIKVTTRQPVVEPYLNFVVEARWPNGRLLREFAVLLDPPTFSANKAAAPVTPASAGAQGAKPRAVQPPTVKTETATTTSAPPADMSLPAAGKPGEYRIQVYDTLSKIANRFKPANDVSVAQTMIAIQRANPQVFIRNNVNLIKSGYVLRLPSADEARAITAEQAAQQVDAQTQEWRGARSSGAAAARSPAAGPQLEASAPPPSQKEGGFREQARLSIATAGSTDKSAAGSGGSGTGVAALREQLTESQEALEKGKRDNRELQSRLDDMERQIATLQRLISLKDDQLAALQAKSTGAKSAALPAAPETEKTAPAPAATEPAAAGAPAAAAPAPAAATPAPATPTPAPVAAKPVVKPALPAPKASAFEKLIADRNYYLYGGIAAMVIGVIAIIVGKRRYTKAREEADALSFEPTEDFQFDASAFDDDGRVDAEDTTAELETETETAGAQESAAPAAEAPKKAVRSETGDPIAESDIYIAYGRYQQAVDLLTQAIDAEPNRSDLRVKLLEVYVEMRNKDAFRQQFVALQSLGDSGAVAHVKDLLSSVDGISDWLDDLPGAANISTVAATAATAAVSAAASAAPDLDLDLDFDDEAATDFDAGLGDDLTVYEPAGDEEPAEFDFDLNDELVVSESETTVSEDILSEREPAPDFDTASLETSSFGQTQSGDGGVAALEEDGLELDLGDDDFDQALSRMGGSDSDNLSDLEEMSTALGDLDMPASAEPIDLDALPEEFDLSQPSTELPEVDRASGDDLGDLDFEEPSFEPSTEPEQPEMDVFAGLNQAGSPPVSAPPEPITATPAAEGGDDFDFLADADEVATKLDLARAYIDMGDTDGAKDILDEVLQEGTDTQKQEASTLLSRMG